MEGEEEQTGEEKTPEFQYAILQVFRNGKTLAYSGRFSNEGVDGGNLRPLDQKTQKDFPITFDYNRQYSPGEIVDLAREKIMELRRRKDFLTGKIDLKFELSVEKVRRA